LAAEQGKQETFDVLHIDVSRTEPGMTNDLRRIDAQADNSTFPGVVHSIRPKSN
jgi:hypothetical protein